MFLINLLWSKLMTTVNTLPLSVFMSHMIFGLIVNGEYLIWQANVIDTKLKRYSYNRTTNESLLIRVDIGDVYLEQACHAPQAYSTSPTGGWLVHQTMNNCYYPITFFWNFGHSTDPISSDIKFFNYVYWIVLSFFFKFECHVLMVVELQF